MEVVTQQSYLPENIRYLRKKMNLSQEELANKIGLNRGNIASYEKGVAEPKNCNLLKLAHVFSISVIDLIEKDLATLNGHYYASKNGAVNGHSIDAEKKQNELKQHLAKAEELQMVVSSLYNCHCFKLKHLDSQDRTTQVLISNFEQLYEITHNLLKSHRELLDLIQEETNTSKPTDITTL